MYNTTNITSILFDMDGTVLESEGLFAKAEHQVLVEYGVDVDISDLNMFRGMPVDLFYREYKKRYSLNEDTSILQNKIKQNLYQLYKTDLVYVDGFISFYKRHILSLKRKTALVTNTELDIVQKVKSSIDISKYFNTIITSTDVDEPKPSPVPYQVAMNILNIKPRNTMIIEDSSSGLRSAVKSGAKVIGLQTTLSKSEILNIDSGIVVVSDYGELSNYLDSFV